MVVLLPVSLSDAPNQFFHQLKRKFPSHDVLRECELFRGVDIVGCFEDRALKIGGHLPEIERVDKCLQGVLRLSSRRI